MMKSVLVALTLVGASVGSAFAGQRTINVWGAQLDLPGQQVEVPSLTSRLDDRGGARFMSAPVGSKFSTARPGALYRGVEDAR